MLLLDFPEFSTPKEAEDALDEMCEDAEEVQYSDKRGWKLNKYRRRINKFFDRFISKCKRKSTKRKDEWYNVMHKAIKARDGLVQNKDIIAEMDKLY